MAKKQRDAIAQARDAVPADLEAALEALLVAYGEQPCPEVSAAIREVSAKFPIGAPIKSKSGRNKFMRTEETARAIDVPMQLAGHDYLDDGIAILGKSRKPDPRIADCIIAVLRALPRRSTAAMAFYGDLFAALAKTRDRSYAAILRDEIRPHLATLKVAALREHVEAKLDATVKTLSKAPAAALSSADARALEELRTALGASERTGDIAALYAAVYANPSDPAPRIVLCDALASTKDPRAELLALQLAPSDRKREQRIKAILKEHRRQLLGTMEPFLLVTSLVFERGFVAHAALKPEIRNFDEKPVGVEWATLESLDFSGNYDTVGALLANPALRFLRHAKNVNLDALLELASSRTEPLALPSLHVGDWYATPSAEDLAKIVGSKAFSNLRTLETSIEGNSVPAALSTALSASRIECVKLRVAKSFRVPKLAGKRIERVGAE